MASASTEFSTRSVQSCYYYPSYVILFSQKRNSIEIVLVPDRCSEIFSRLIEALFITHAQTKLNTLGHLDGMIVENNNSNDTNARMTSDRRSDEWCQNLLRRPTTSNSQRSRIMNTYRSNPHFQ